MKRKLFLLITGLIAAASLFLALLLAVNEATAQDNERPAPTPVVEVVYITVTVPAPTPAPVSTGISALGVMAAPDPRLTQAEIILRPFWRDLIIRQREFYAIYGTFYQGSIILPGANFTRTVTVDTPTDQGLTWADFMGGEFNYTIPLPLMVDVYDSPVRGAGFSLYARALGYEKRVCYGRRQCSYDWRPVVVPVP